MSRALWAVLPGGIDDPAAPSGGNRYDRIVLSLLDREVHEIAVPGSWPAPAAPARLALARSLGGIPDGAPVLIDGLVGCGVPEILEPHATRLRLIILVHLPLSDETGLSEPAAAGLRALERRALHLASAVVATSRQAAAHIEQMHDLSGKSDLSGEGGTSGEGDLFGSTAGVKVVEPGVEAAPLAEPSVSGKRLLCVASVTPRKGQDLLVRVLQEELAGLDWTCTFVGALVRPVPHRDERIRFAGPRTGTDLDAEYAGADLFVLASRAETYGMVVTEALARGLPVIATDVGGVGEALGFAADGSRPGQLVPPDDPAALAAALRSWLTDPGLRERWRSGARERRATLPSWAATAAALNRIVDDVI